VIKENEVFVREFRVTSPVVHKSDLYQEIEKVLKKDSSNFSCRKKVLTLVESIFEPNHSFRFATTFLFQTDQLVRAWSIGNHSVYVQIEDTKSYTDETCFFAFSDFLSYLDHLEPISDLTSVTNELQHALFFEIFGLTIDEAVKFWQK
jgi:hypothetical protein